MLIYIIRHGIAEDVSEDGDDASRVLTDDGIAKTKRVAKGLARLIDPPEQLLTSPKERAAQTARILAKHLGVTPTTLDKLGLENVAGVVHLLQHSTVESIALVGHEPTLSHLVETLCTGSDKFSFVQLKKAGAACIEIERSRGKLRIPGRLLWLATPKMLAALA